MGSALCWALTLLMRGFDKSKDIICDDANKTLKSGSLTVNISSSTTTGIIEIDKLECASYMVFGMCDGETEFTSLIDKINKSSPDLLIGNWTFFAVGYSSWRGCCCIYNNQLWK